jgi:hypothetical protein
MEWVDKILGRAAAAPKNDPAAEVQSLVITPDRPYLNRAALKAFVVRKGMWAVVDGKVGILTGCDKDMIAEVTLIKPDRTTVMVLNADDQVVPARLYVPLDQVRRAYLEELPTGREMMDVESLRSLGYCNRSEA